MRALLVGLLVLGALLLGGSAAHGVGASVGFRPSGVVPHSGSTPAVNTAGAFTCGAITCDAYETGINIYFTDVAADNGGANNVYSALTQYSDSTGNIAYDETFGGSFVDEHAYPANGCPTAAASTCLTEAQLVAEIGNVLSAKGWTANGTNLFFILLPAGVDTCFGASSGSGCASNVFCAYHDSSASLIFAVQPFAAGWGCNGSSAGEGIPNGPEIDESVNVISHEQNEAISDPVNAWWAADGNENGDLCAWSFGSPLGTTPGGEPYNQVINGHKYSLQLEYSNAANSGGGGCVSYLGGPAGGASVGTGPLLYHGGAVMRTNTVYTIYWFPGITPAISISPVVTGAAAVGQQLSTTDGTWSGSPTGYAYRWQRCNNVGLNCVNIANATSSTHTLVTADAGHKIRSVVLASNAVGPAASGYAPSALTPVVAGKPAVIKLPKLSGVATVGSSLAVSDGTWKYSPTSYAYQWLRCSSLGMSCKKIVGATNSSYLLTAADAGHKLEAKVAATNAAGSATAASKPSGKVKN